MRLALRIGIAITIAAAVLVSAFYILFFGSAYLFVHLFPYDGQDGLGAIGLALFGAPVLSLTSGVLSFIYLDQRAKRGLAKQN